MPSMGILSVRSQKICKLFILPWLFFGALERLFWQQPGVYSTSAGYSGGVTENPTS